MSREETDRRKAEKRYKRNRQVHITVCRYTHLAKARRLKIECSYISIGVYD